MGPFIELHMIIFAMIGA